MKIISFSVLSTRQSVQCLQLGFTTNLIVSLKKSGDKNRHHYIWSPQVSVTSLLPPQG